MRLPSVPHGIRIEELRIPMRGYEIAFIDRC